MCRHYGMISHLLNEFNKGTWIGGTKIPFSFNRYDNLRAYPHCNNFMLPYATTWNEISYEEDQNVVQHGGLVVNT